jgi:hypothetical protein
MICYACGEKAQRKETRLAKKEKREPRITSKCGSWKKGQCEKCRKKKVYITEISDFLLIDRVS